MDLEQLRQLDTIARCGTLSAATKVCHASQPALSRSMQRLEAECGQQLFTRSKNHLALNEAGSIVLEHARAILREERSMRDSLDRLAKRERLIVICSVAPAPVWMITELTVKRFPGTVFQIEHTRNDDAASQLLGRSADIVFTTMPLDIAGCISVKAVEEHLSALIPISHPLAHKASITFAQLEGESFLVDSSAGFWLDMVRDCIPHARFIEQSDRNVLFQLVETSGMLSFVTNMTESWSIPKGFARVPIEDDGAHVTFYMTTLPDAADRVHDIAALISPSSL